MLKFLARPVPGENRVMSVVLPPILIAQQIARDLLETTTPLADAWRFAVLTGTLSLPLMIPWAALVPAAGFSRRQRIAVVGLVFLIGSGIVLAPYLAFWIGAPE
jgi:hypothetical protein